MQELKEPDYDYFIVHDRLFRERAWKGIEEEYIAGKGWVPQKIPV